MRIGRGNFGLSKNFSQVVHSEADLARHPIFPGGKTQMLMQTIRRERERYLLTLWITTAAAALRRETAATSRRARFA
jgi:hypothetical protein